MEMEKHKHVCALRPGSRATLPTHPRSIPSQYAPPQHPPTHAHALTHSLTHSHLLSVPCPNGCFRRSGEVYCLPVNDVDNHRAGMSIFFKYTLLVVHTLSTSPFLSNNTLHQCLSTSPQHLLNTSLTNLPINTFVHSSQSVR